MIEFLKVHPATTLDLVDLGFYKNVDCAYQSLKRLEDRRKINRIGFDTSNEVGGRSPIIFSARYISTAMSDHEYKLTKFCLLFSMRWIRGKFTNRLIRPDAETFEGQKFYIELDNNTERTRALYKRIKVYEQNKHLFHGEKNDAGVVWLCPSLERLEQIRQLTKSIENFCLFAVLDDVLADPDGEHFYTLDGHCVRLGIPLVKRLDGTGAVDGLNGSQLAL